MVITFLLGLGLKVENSIWLLRIIALNLILPSPNLEEPSHVVLTQVECSITPHASYIPTCTCVLVVTKVDG